jgi:acyl carrier protein
MTEPEIYDTLTAIFRAAMTDDSLVLTAETSPKDIAKWDSFHYVDIILQIEDTLGIKIRSREANKLRNVGELAALIQSKQADA